MAKSGENLPLDKNWKPDFGARGSNHVYRDGEYVEVAYEFQEYPKAVGKYVAENAEDEAEFKKRIAADQEREEREAKKADKK